MVRLHRCRALRLAGAVALPCQQRGLACIHEICGACMAYVFLEKPLVICIDSMLEVYQGI